MIQNEIKLDDKSFWNIIEHVREELPQHYDTKIFSEHLSDYLATKDENTIIGFEYAFRDRLKESNHYDIMAVVKICEGFVSDDSFLYFRAGLVSFGKEVFYGVINSADKYAHILVKNTLGEYMLYVSDDAYKKKPDVDDSDELPRDLAIAYYDYDFMESDPSGEDWVESELSIRFPELCKIADF